MGPPAGVIMRNGNGTQGSEGLSVNDASLILTAAGNEKENLKSTVPLVTSNHIFSKIIILLFLSYFCVRFW